MVGAPLNIRNLTRKPSAGADSTATIKFLCSYGGKILPRYPDGKLRYHGGETRVISVERSISFAELLMKLGELCGTPVNLRCQLPTEDLDALVSITSDEDLVNLIEEYDRSASPPKIRAFLSPPKKPSPPPSTSPDAYSPKSYRFPVSVRGSNSDSPKSLNASVASGGSFVTLSRFSIGTPRKCIQQIPNPAVFPLRYKKSAGKLPQYAYHGQGDSREMYQQ